MIIDDVDDDIRSAIASHSEEAEQTSELEPEIVEDEPLEPVEEDKPAPTEEKKEVAVEKDKLKQKAVAQKSEAPQVPPAIKASLPPAIQAKWATLPEDVRAEWERRENNIQQMMTRHDGELRIGREMKEVIQPYMPLIQAEGGTPAKAVQALLNTAYVLRTGSPQQKEQLIRQTAAQYGVDLGTTNDESEYQDPVVLQLQQQVMNLQQQLSPQNLQNYLQSYNESSKVDSEVSAFASDPANVHYQQVAPVMAALVSSGRASTLKEAYEAACYADPSIRQSLLAEQQKQAEEKRRSELAAKKKAAGSVSGSPGKTAFSAPSSNYDSIEDDLRAAFRAASGRI